MVEQKLKSPYTVAREIVAFSNDLHSVPCEQTS